MASELRKETRTCRNLPPDKLEINNDQNYSACSLLWRNRAMHKIYYTILYQVCVFFLFFFRLKLRSRGRETERISNKRKI